MLSGVQGQVSQGLLQWVGMTDLFQRHRSKQRIRQCAVSTTRRMILLLTTMSVFVMPVLLLTICKKGGRQSSGSDDSDVTAT